MVLGGGGPSSGRGRLKDRLIGQPCAYCAGARVSTTIDHMPAKVVFLGKHRPRGLEFPSCEECNKATSNAELFAAVMTREPATPEDVEELRKLMQGVRDTVPGLMEELFAYPPWLGPIPVALGQPPPLYVAGPLVHHHMRLFAAKFGFAMHHALTGVPLSAMGGVLGRWFTEPDGAHRELPNTMKLMGLPTTLAQGVKTVRDQFEYQTYSSKTLELNCSVIRIRKSISLLAVSATDRRSLFKVNNNKWGIWAPGDLVAGIPSVTPTGGGGFPAQQRFMGPAASVPDR